MSDKPATALLQQRICARLRRPSRDGAIGRPRPCRTHCESAACRAHGRASSGPPAVHLRFDSHPWPCAGRRARRCFGDVVLCEAKLIRSTANWPNRSAPCRWPAPSSDVEDDAALAADRADRGMVLDHADLVLTNSPTPRDRVSAAGRTELLEIEQNVFIWTSKMGRVEPLALQLAPVSRTALCSVLTRDDGLPLVLLRKMVGRLHASCSDSVAPEVTTTDLSRIGPITVPPAPGPSRPRPRFPGPRHAERDAGVAESARPPARHHRIGPRGGSHGVVAQ